MGYFVKCYNDNLRVCVFIAFATDNSYSDEHPDTAGAVGVPGEPAPDRIHPQPRQPEGL